MSAVFYCVGDVRVCCGLSTGVSPLISSGGMSWAEEKKGMSISPHNLSRPFLP